MAGSQGNRFVQKEQRRPVPGRIEFEVMGPEFCQTGDPQIAGVVPDQTALLVHQTATVACEQTAGRNRMQIPERVDPVTSWVRRGHERHGIDDTCSWNRSAPFRSTPLRSPPEPDR
jgi:hypothetical protein